MRNIDQLNFTPVMDETVQRISLILEIRELLTCP